MDYGVEKQMIFNTMYVWKKMIRPADRRRNLRWQWPLGIWRNVCDGCQRRVVSVWCRLTCQQRSPEEDYSWCYMKPNIFELNGRKSKSGSGMGLFLLTFLMFILSKRNINYRLTEKILQCRGNILVLGENKQNMTCKLQSLFLVLQELALK